MITPDDLLGLAATLAQTTDSEVHQRESVIASYYAAFHQCRQLANKLANYAGMNKKTGSHLEVINKLSHYPTTNNAEQLPIDSAMKIRSLGYRLLSCRNQRTLASYELDQTLTLQAQEKHTAQVTKLLATLTQLQATHPELNF